jgi:hypothetical protein
MCQHRFALALAIMALATACISSPTNSMTPAAVADTAMAPDQPPQLDGYVANVDGKVVPQNRAVDLSPGCHLVGTPMVFKLPETLSFNRPEQQTIVTGRRLFAVTMKAGHRYTVQVETWSSAILPDIGLYEWDADGKTTNVFRPVAENRGANGCRELLPAAQRSED